MIDERNKVDPYRYGEARKGPLRDFLPNLLESWRDKTPLSGWEFGVGCYWLNFAMLFCALPGIGLVVGPLAYGTFCALCRRRYAAGEVPTWAYRLVLLSVASLCLALQAVGLGLVFRALSVPIILWVFASAALAQFAVLYMRYRGGPFGLSDGREWRAPGTLRFLVDQFKIDKVVETDAAKRVRPVLDAAEKADT